MMAIAAWALMCGLATAATDSTAGADIATPSASGIAADIAQVSDSLAALGVQVKALTSNDVAAQTRTGIRPYAQRLADAEVYYVMGDYFNAALMLYTMAQTDDAQQPDYAKVIAYLAESLYQMHSDLLARRYFQSIFQRGDTAHMADAARRLIEIGERRGAWEGLDAAIATLRKQGPLPGDIAYQYAKGLLHQQRGADAVAAADEVPAEDPLALKARYVRGVALVQNHDLEGAAKVFEGLAQEARNSSADGAADVARLATLDRARLLLDLGLVHKSIALYRSIPEQSPSYTDALYEQTWAQLDAAKNAPDDDTRDEAFENAQQNLDLLMLDPNVTPVTPEANLLSANLLLRVGRYDAAEKAFAGVVERYKPLCDQVDALAQANPDATRIFIADPNKPPEQTGMALLPPLAAAYAADEKDLPRTVAISQELDQSETWLRESDSVIDKLDRALDAQQKAHLAAGLQDLLARQVELQTHLVQQTVTLLSVERRVVAPHLTPAQQTELASIAQERAGLASEYQKLPQSRDAYEGRTQSLRRQLGELQKQQYTLKWVIREQQQQLEALRSWLTDNPNTLTPAGMTETMQRLATEAGGLAELETTRGQLNDDIDALRTLMAVVNADQAHDDQVRSRYEANLERERQLLNAGLANVTGADRGTMDQVEKLRGMVASLRDDLEGFRDHMSAATARLSVDSRAALQRQTQDVQSTLQELAGVRRAAAAVVPQLAARALQNVRDKMQDIVQRGDVGVIDVAWGLKEQQTEEVNRRVSETHDEQQSLEATAKELLTKD